eukprot:751249-Hanusia_phi.AAC.4
MPASRQLLPLPLNPCAHLAVIPSLLYESRDPPCCSRNSSTWEGYHSHPPPLPLIFSSILLLPPSSTTLASPLLRLILLSSHSHLQHHEWVSFLSRSFLVSHVPATLRCDMVRLRPVLCEGQATIRGEDTGRGRRLIDTGSRGEEQRV